MREGKDKGLIFYFHPTFLLVALGFILTGFYLNLITFTLLILIHELGHYLSAKLFKVKVKKIIIYPYGGKTILEDYINRDIHQEFFISSAGIIFQFIFYLIILLLFKLGFIRPYLMNLFKHYNQQIIFFNLLPIYPLDGGRMLYLLTCLIIPYYYSNILISIFSFLLIILLLVLNIYKYNYSNFMVFILLITYIYKFYQKRHLYFNKFLLERYLYQVNFSNIKKINKLRNMYRNRTHLIKNNSSYKKERYVLRHLFTRENNK